MRRLILCPPGSYRHFKHVIAAVLGMAFAAGCGDSVYRTAVVTGTVTCNGTPAVGGTVIFRPLDAPEKTGRPRGNPGRASRGVVDEDGNFTLMVDTAGADGPREGAVIGPHEVTFLLPRTKPREVDPRDLSLPADELAKLKEDLANEPVFEPLECGDVITPGNVEVVAGANDFEFTLKPGATGPVPRSLKRSQADSE